MLPLAPKIVPSLYQQAAATAPVTLADFHIAAVIPAYNEAQHIAQVVSSLPDFIRTIIVVDDCSRDATASVVETLQASDPRVVLVRHEKNQGVGGAMISGFRRAIDLEAQIIVKLDGDGQMAAENLASLLRPLITGEADYAKGNRFHDFRALAKMPALRRMGNMGLSFLTKAAVGYWNCFDPCNGFVAIRVEILSALPLHAIHKTYFFETSMLAQLYLLGAVVRDVPMPARYGNEVSHLSITRVLREFPPKLLAAFVKRLILKNFIYDFSMESVFLLASFLLLSAGTIFGGWNWIHYALAGVGAPTGTVVLASMLIVLGFQLLLSAISEDLRQVPRVPLCDGALQPQRPSRSLNANALSTDFNLREPLPPASDLAKDLSPIPYPPQLPPAAPSAS